MSHILRSFWVIFFKFGTRPFERRIVGVYHDLIFTEAIEQVEALVASSNATEIGERIDKIAASSDLSQACLMLLVVKAKGIDTSGKTGVELANLKPTIAELILPPGVTL